MARVEIRLLGGFLFVVDDNVVSFPTRKAEAIFAYLVLNHQRSIARNSLVGVFWPDIDDDRARRNLSTTLWRVRTTIKSATGIRITSNGSSVTLYCGDVETDAVRFKMLLESAAKLDGERRREALRQAEVLYGGDLLDGFDYEWCDQERRHIRALYIRLLTHLIQASKTAGDYDAGIMYSQKILALDPLDEDTHRESMLLYHLKGDRVASLAQYDTLRRVLQDELGVEPSDASRELWEYIRSRTGSGLSQRSQQPAWDGKLATLYESAQTPIVGREQQLDLLVRALECAAQGQGSATVISGDAGIGKTKLVEALAVEAGLRDFEVLQAQCPDLQDPPPYQVFIQALWPRITFASTVNENASPLTSLIRGLVPDAYSWDGESNRRVPTGIFDSAIVVETLIDLLTDDHGRHPIMLILEDLHKIDKASTTLLATLLGRLEKRRLFLVATVRTKEGMADHILSIFTASGTLELKLDNLSESETAMLVRTTLGSGHVPSSVIRYMWDRTNGTPLFVLEFLKLLRANGLLARDPLGHWFLSEQVFEMKDPKIPLRVQEVVRKRIGMLDQHSKRILQAAAVLGLELDFEILRQFTELQEEELLEYADHLLSSQLLKETEKGFHFRHESIRTIALSMLNKTRLRRLHRKAGVLLERMAPGRTEDLAWHFENASDFKKAFTYAEASGDRAWAVYANPDAIAWYTRSLKIWDTLGSKDPAWQRRRAQLLLKRQEVFARLGDCQGRSDDIGKIMIIAEGLGDQGLLAEALCLRADLLVRINQTEPALECARRSIQSFRSIGNIQGEARAHEAAGQVYVLVRRPDLAQVELQGALSLFRQIGDKAGEARTLAQLGTALSIQGEDAAALSVLDLAETVLRGSEDSRSQAVVSSQRGILLRFLGKVALSESLLLAGIDIFKRTGDQVWEARALSQLACTHVVMGKMRDALHEARGALRLARQAQDVRARIICLNNAAYMVYAALGDFRRAEQCVVEIMKFVAQSSEIENRANYADTMASILLERGDLEAALSWGKQSEAFYSSSGRNATLEGEIQRHLGLIYLESGQYRYASRYLRSALTQFRRSNELALQPHAVVALARLELARGALKIALKYVREASNLLRRIDGVEQIQKIYWTQYRVLHAAGMHAAARRALRKAYTSVMLQASTLKGRIRRRFLTEVKVNREILEEVEQARQTSFYREVGSAGPSKASKLQVAERDRSTTTGRDRNDSSPIEDGNARGKGIDDRRRAMLRLLQSSRMTQVALARTLGVSVRTIRNDVVALRRQGSH